MKEIIKIIIQNVPEWIDISGIILRYIYFKIFDTGLSIKQRLERNSACILEILLF